MSLGGHRSAWSSTAVGTPADIGTSYGGFTAATTPSCQPWKCPWNFRIFGRPVKARAMRRARCVASVPDMVKRTIWAEGISFCTSSAHRTSSSWLAPRCVPRATCSWTALTTAGWQWPRNREPCPIQ